MCNPLTRKWHALPEAPILRRIASKIINQTNTMEDVSGAFNDLSNVIKCKVNNNDPNMKIALSRLEKIQEICRASGALNESRNISGQNISAAAEIFQLQLKCLHCRGKLRAALPFFKPLGSVCALQRENTRCSGNSVEKQCFYEIIVLTLAINFAYLSANRLHN
ncbi:hypothetical protein L484_008443 [Morus notabilis]|uniref:Uncharacterized protein n=1 Tax=Morus notabilis TaxID=981085 RepID=W9S3F2_9ROSA|nr:hypothetical protein L484_008443 [Morus notabilis]